MKLQMPASNIQRNTNNRPPTQAGYVFEVWRSEFLWSLELGDWNLRFCQALT
jgi:hypothetical protein